MPVQEFLLPDLGEGLTEAEIVSWLVAPGDTIAIDQPVVEVESAKSVVELPSPYGGRVQSLRAAAGDTVRKGSALMTVAPLDATVPDAASAVLQPSTPATTVASGSGAVAGSGVASGSGAVLVGYGTSESTMRLRRPAEGRFGRGTAAAASGAAMGAATADTAPAPAAAAAPAHAPAAAAAPAHAPAAALHRSPVVSPLVRKLAREHGIDATTLHGSGRDALVLRADVESAIADAATSPASTRSAAPAATPAHLDQAAGGDTRIPLTGLRKLVAERLSTSRRVIPEATIWMDVDATELLAAKHRLQSATGERFSLTALIARFTVAALKRYPVLNASVSNDSSAIIQHPSVNLGLAAQTPRGLMVPVVHGADELTTRQLRDAIAAIVATGESGDFSPAALRGGTFTLNNYGGFGVDGSTPIINHPEVAMLGIGRVLERPWVVDHRLAVRQVVQLSFVFDHRVCDGDVASGFLTFVARCIEEPLLLLGEV